MSESSAAVGNAGHAGIEIVDAGPLALVEDLGRAGHAALGVGRSGALDRGGLRLANRLVGNPEGVAGIEFTLGPFAVRFLRDAWFALGGAWGEVRLDGRVVEPYDAVAASAGGLLTVGVATRGLRYYLALRGGIGSDVVLGSRSTDTLSGVGGPPLQAGALLPVGAVPAGAVPAVDTLTVAPPPEGTVVVRAHPGPRTDWFTAAVVDRFYDAEWVVSGNASRVGMALDAADASTLERSRPGELPSEAMLAGAVQVSHSGTPTVLLADHPVTGGYPVIAVVTEADLDALGQVRPGQRLRFRHPLR